MKTLIVILVLLISFSIKAVELDIGDYPNVFGITIGEKFEKTCIESDGCKVIEVRKRDADDDTPGYITSYRLDPQTITKELDLSHFTVEVSPKTQTVTGIRYNINCAEEGCFPFFIKQCEEKIQNHGTPLDISFGKSKCGEGFENSSMLIYENNKGFIWRISMHPAWTSSVSYGLFCDYRFFADRFDRKFNTSPLCELKNLEIEELRKDVGIVKMIPFTEDKRLIHNCIIDNGDFDFWLSFSYLENDLKIQEGEILFVPENKNKLPEAVDTMYAKGFIQFASGRTYKGFWSYLGSNSLTGVFFQEYYQYPRSTLVIKLKKRTIYLWQDHIPEKVLVGKCEM